MSLLDRDYVKNHPFDQRSGKERRHLTAERNRFRRIAYRSVGTWLWIGLIVYVVLFYE